MQLKNMGTILITHYATISYHADCKKTSRLGVMQESADANSIHSQTEKNRINCYIIA